VWRPAGDGKGRPLQQIPLAVFVTAMSPLQFQKQLRLQKARRLMLGEHLDAGGAAYRVGYDDTSHFNRDYKRLFGEPPMRDVERLQNGTTESVGI
jgi:AraC-like DNA-binding protein